MISSVLGTKVKPEERIFHSRKYNFDSGFIPTQSILIQAMNKCQYSKLSTFAHKHILRKPTKKRGRNSRMKYSVCVTGSASGVT